MFNIEDAKSLLNSADVFFPEYDDEPETNGKLILNMNDIWAWACADGEEVPEECLPELAELFWRYGYCGILYWVSERNNQMKSEFVDINRFIQFVREEERLRKTEPSSSKRAYKKVKYEIGV